MVQRIPLDRVKAIAARALDHGAEQTALTSWRWNVAGKCRSPHRVSLEGRHTRKPLPAVGFTKSGKRYWHEKSRFRKWSNMDVTTAPMWLDLDVGCRRCEACLRARGVHWRERIKSEINAAQRTWFGTLTLTPEEQYLAQCRAGAKFETLSDADKFLARHRAISPLITNAVKRVRKRGGENLRLICVAEAHKSGLPHYHMLIHEPWSGGRVTHALLTEAWPHGFSKWKLVQDPHRAANYVAKYLFKTAIARVRASSGYGDPARSLARGSVAVPHDAQASAPRVKIKAPEKDGGDGGCQTVAPLVGGG